MMGRQLWLADVARSAGLTVVELDGWRTRGSESFAPEGTMWHHTADGPGEFGSARTVTFGRGKPGDANYLPGPLCNYGLGRSGTVYVVAAGRANHAGAGTWKGLSGNSKFIGIEAENRGTTADPWPAVQLDAYVRLTAAVQKRLGRDSGYVCAHREYATPQGRKPDPHSLDMPAIRTRVSSVMAGDQQEDGFMAALTDAEQRELLDRTRQIHAVTAASGYIEQILQLLQDHVEDPATGDGTGGIDRAVLREELAKLTLSVGS